MEFQCDTDVHAMRKGTRPKQFGKRGSKPKRARPRERTQSKTGTVVNCTLCGKTPDKGKCPDWSQKCRACQGLKHFFAKYRKFRVNRRDVITVGNKEYGVSSLIDDSVTRHSVNRVEGRHKDAGYVTLGIRSHRIQFECDTGSQYNILLLSDYNLATGDTNLHNLTSIRYTSGAWREESEGDGDHNTSKSPEMDVNTIK